MKDDDRDDFQSRSWYADCYLVVAVPLVLFALLPLLLVIAPIGIFCLICTVVSEFSLRLSMQRRGRGLRMSELRRRITANGGTLIVEYLSPGWRLSHAWWTPDDLVAQSPYSMPDEDEFFNAFAEAKCLDWEKWCWRNYTSPDCGRAFLVRVWNGACVERELKHKFPGLTVVHTCTCLALFPESPKPPDSRAA